MKYEAICSKVHPFARPYCCTYHRNLDLDLNILLAEAKTEKCCSNFPPSVLHHYFSWFWNEDTIINNYKITRSKFCMKMPMSNILKILEGNQSLSFEMSSRCFHKQLEVSLVVFGEDLDDFWRLDCAIRITCQASRNIQKSWNLAQRPFILLGFIRQTHFWCSHLSPVQDLDEEGHGINPLIFFSHF